MLGQVSQHTQGNVALGSIDVWSSINLLIIIFLKFDSFRNISTSSILILLLGIVFVIELKLEFST